jgi:hypothetical protein
MKNLKFFLTLPLFILSIFSCDDIGNDIQEEMTEGSYLDFAVQSSSSSSNPYDFVGVNHNALLDEILPLPQIFNTPEDLENFVIAEGLQFTGQPISTDYHIMVSIGIDEVFRNNYINTNKSEMYANFVFDFIDDLKELNTVDQIHTLINNKVGEISTSSFSVDEKSELYGFLAVSEHSASYWMPTALGGQGKSELLDLSQLPYADTTGEDVPQGIAWHKVILSDAAGAVIGGAMTLNPVGSTLGLVGASVQSLINQSSDCPC